MCFAYGAASVVIVVAIIVTVAIRRHPWLLR